MTDNVINLNKSDMDKANEAFTKQKRDKLFKEFQRTFKEYIETFGIKEVDPNSPINLESTTVEVHTLFSEGFRMVTTCFQLLAGMTRIDPTSLLNLYINSINQEIARERAKNEPNTKQ